MLERLDKLVFYFTIDCANCRNLMKISHVVVEEQKGLLLCSLCGKNIKVPDSEILVRSAKDLNAYLGDSLNAKFIKLHLNETFVGESSVPAVGH